jgi:hypothetical protein
LDAHCTCIEVSLELEKGGQDESYEGCTLTSAKLD